ncbi:putative PBP superfamily domain containing protein [Lyophyllum shimeji]|uniref:PBP superfamily domain containing protein n=1 Tax=Lyophyllum shimeji TaxID=47721 RepID=A0A9P3PRT2_LYOSH|nr:putative PBP superfamily domain containing protein [Lyophyllum shimeji]
MKQLLLYLLPPPPSFWLSSLNRSGKMYFDLNVPIPSLAQAAGQAMSKKAKGKQPVAAATAAFTASQIGAMEARVDLLVHLGYTVIAFNQLAHKRVDPRSHVNTAESLVSQLRKRPGIVYLKRLSIILDEDSEKGFGLTNANAAMFTSYDLIGLVPLTQATFALACLTHSMPSPLTAHIISLPLTLPRLSFYLKHTLIRTAIKNGAVFEISYVGALGGENDPVLTNAGGAENGAAAKRNWWAATRELTRVTKGKSLIVGGGVVADADLRAPTDVGNLITLLGLAQDVAHASLTKVPKSLVLRAQTRNTYRAVFSEPTVVVLEGTEAPVPPTIAALPTSEPQVSQAADTGDSTPGDATPASSASAPQTLQKKRPREGEPEAGAPPATAGPEDSQKKKRKKNKGGQQIPREPHDSAVLCDSWSADPVTDLPLSYPHFSTGSAIVLTEENEYKNKLARIIGGSEIQAFKARIEPITMSVESQSASIVTNPAGDENLDATVKIPSGLYVGVGVGTKDAGLKPQATYNGGCKDATEIRLRIANGGAGQSGLIGAWADAFIQYSVKTLGQKPFKVGWYLGDTTESLGLLAAGSVDIAVTYNDAAERQAVVSRAASRREYGFRDHFLLVGPKSNPAGLDKDNDDILMMFNKIVSSGNVDVASPPDLTKRPAVRFLSRFDKSATNIKESELFITIGQVPWALVYSKWYHQYPRFPLQALEAASLLSEYTLTDRGTWLSSPPSITGKLEIFKAGLDLDPADPLLNPAHVLLGSKADRKNVMNAKSFMDWVVRSDGGQKVIREFMKYDEVLYSEAPSV